MRDSKQGLFGEIRSLFAQDPPDTAYRWHKLLEILGPFWEERDFLEHKVIPYVLDYLKDTDERDLLTPQWRFDTLPHPVWLLGLTMHKDHAGLTDAHIAHFAESPYIRNLESLVLWDNSLTSEGVKVLAASPYASNLTYLDLAGNHIRAQGALYLAESPYLKKLTHLDLSHNALGVQGAKVLAAAFDFPNLRVLRLEGNAIGKEGHDALEKAGLGSVVYL